MPALILLMTGAAGSSENALVSKSYLEGEYEAARLKVISEKVAELDIYAESKINSLLNSGGTENITLKPDSTDGLTYGSGAAVRCAGNRLFTAARGAVFLVTEDAAANFSVGTVADLTEGVSAAPGGVSSNHTYIVLEGSAKILTGDGLDFIVTGWYSITDAQFDVFTIFTDVKQTDWFYPAVEYVYINGYFNGTSASEFSPGGTMTRAMFVTVLHRLAGKPAPDTAAINTFSDVADTSSYYYDAVIWASSYGITTGYGDGTFQPNGNVTREQMAVFLYRYAVLTGSTDDFDGSRAESFPDYGEISEYAVEALSWACARGVINGSDGMLLPQSHSTRAQVAQLIMNYDTLKEPPAYG